MKPLSQSAMLEATRLTREGRLSEAMAVLKGGSAGTPRSDAPANEDLALQGPTLDLDPPSSASGGTWSATTTGAEARRNAPAAPSEAAPAGLAGAVTRLARGRLGSALAGLPGMRAPRPEAPVPTGARFEERLYAGDGGSRRYKLYIPSSYDGTPRPLVVMLHGCTQSPDDFALGTRMNEHAEARGVVVAYPAQSQSANASRCWNWFNPADQERGRGEPAIIAGIVREIMSDVAIDEARIFVAGLSAGGATAAIMAARYPEIFSGVGIHSGLACGAANDAASAFAVMRQGSGPSSTRIAIPTIVFHGDRDQTVNPVNADSVTAQARPQGRVETSIVEGMSEGGMRFTRTVQSDEAGRERMEQWVLHGAGHAWSGGSTAGSYTDPAGPDASAEMLRFFLQSDGPAAIV